MAHNHRFARLQESRSLLSSFCLRPQIISCRFHLGSVWDHRSCQGAHRRETTHHWQWPFHDHRLRCESLSLQTFVPWCSSWQRESDLWMDSWSWPWMTIYPYQIEDQVCLRTQSDQSNLYRFQDQADINLMIYRPCQTWRSCRVPLFQFQLLVLSLRTRRV